MKNKYLLQKSKNIFICTVLFFIFSIKVSAQCSFTGAESSPRETITFCIDNSNTVVTTNTFTAGQYVAVNVVKGFSYTFRFPELFGGAENLTLFNASNTSTSLAYINSTTSADLVLNWTATISGQIYALVSRGACNNAPSTRSAQMTITLNSVGNTQDSQTTFGTNEWVGHVYNWTGSAPPGGTSSATPSGTTSPFTNANYVGYYNIASETINEGFGGSTSCFPVLSNGVNRTTIYTELFAVRYRMKSTRAAGCYLLNVNGDDGVRVYVDNVLVFDQWKEQGNTSYCNNLIYLNGNSDIVLDYYENTGGNVVGFSLTPFNGSTNSISSSSDVVVCSGSSPGVVDGSAFGGCNGGTNTVYQWQVSSDNITFTDISGANTEDYTPTAATTTTASIVRYYRRVVKAFTSNAGSCSFNTAAVKVTTNPSVKNFTVAPSSSTCPSTDVTYTTQSGMTNYVWTVPGALGTDYSITSGSLGTTSNSVTLKWLTAGSKTVTVNYTSSCTSAAAATNTTTVILAPNNVSNGFSASTICIGDTPKITFDADDTGFVGPYTITYKNNSSPTIYTITIPTAAATSFTPGDNPTTNTTYTLLSIANSTCTRTSDFGSSGANLIVRALPTATINGTTTVCQGSSSPDITFANPQTAAIIVTYNINGGASATVEVASSSTTTVTVSTTASGTYTYNLTKVEYKALANCSSVITGKSAVVTVNSLSVAPTAILGTTTICNGSSTTLSVSGGSVGTGAVAKWYSGSCGGALVGSGNSITVSPTSTTLYFVRYEGTCNATSCFSTTVTVNSNTVSVASSNTTVCKGSSISSITHATTGATGIGSAINLPSGLVANWSSNTITISGTPTTAGTFNYSIPLSGGCGIVSAIGTIIVNNSGLITLAKTDKSCSTVNNGSINATLSGGLSSVQYIKLTQKYSSWQQVQEIQAYEVFTGTNVALSSNGATATASSTYQNNIAGFGPQKAIDGDAIGYSFWHSNSVNINEFIKIDLSSGKNIDLIRIFNRSDCCQDRGQNMLLELFDSSNNVVYSKTINLWGGVNGANFVDVNVLDVSWLDGATSLSRSSLDNGVFTLNYNDANNCASVASTTIGTTLITSSYNGLTSTWSPFAPGTGITGIITNSGTIAGDIDLCSCTVNPGVAATIAAGVMMRLQNELIVTGTGSITFKKNSSLVQINATASNSGSIFYERETTPITNFDYTYWSSPVAGQKLIDFSPNTLGDKFLSFNSFSNSWNYEDAYNNLMGKGVGYIIRGPQTKSGQPPSTQLYRFTGAPNNGPVSLPIGAAGNSVLLGNPYPSALDADKFLDANASLIEGTIYFWTHNTSLRLASSLAAGTAGSGSYAYTSDDYAAYNRTGGVATYAAPSASDLSPSSPIVSGNAPTSNIGAGQSFFGTSLAAGSVQFTNNMRVGFTGLASNSNSQFFKTTSAKKMVETVDKNRIWIDLTNEEGAFKETLLGYITGASNAFETAFDGESYDANAFVDFYSINEDKKLTIQGRALPFDDSDIIPLGYKANIGGQFSITIRDKDGLFTTQNVYLEDKLLVTVIDLSEGTYKFTTETGVFNDRFAIRYTGKTLGVEVFDPVAEGVYISTKNKVITVQVGTETIASASVYDLAGKLLFANKAVDLNQMSISNLSAANVVLVVKVVLNNGSVVTQKIVY
ncbi:MAG: T9SS sorting signal type C domain-containing protein [Flavobacteriaceae bacterium]|nr:T9SS sorting signal type C domain-containing protein [Flavobacteriaceae bacterium]